MNEEIKQRLMSYLDQLEKTVTNITDFSSQEIPLYIQEFLCWSFYDNLISAIEALLACIVVIILNRMGHKKIVDMMKRDKDCDVLYIPLFILSAIALGMSLTVLTLNAKDCIKITVAPRVFIVEKLMEIR